MDKKLILAGAFGAVVPSLVNAAVVDTAFLASMDTFMLVGYLIRVVALMLIGAVMVAVQDVGDVKRALQIGMVAPALVTALVNGQNVAPAQPVAHLAPSSGFSLVTEAYAQPVTVATPPPPPPAPTQTDEPDAGTSDVLKRVFRGFTGSRAE